MKHFTFTTRIAFMALATVISAIPQNPDIPLTTNNVANMTENFQQASDESLEPTYENNETGSEDDESDETDESIPSTAELPLLFIKAFNPGFNIGDDKEKGEFIELYNSTGQPLDLTDVSLVYRNTKDTPSVLYEFPDGAIMAGETIVLRYRKSPEASMADDVYKNSMALTGNSLQLLLGDEVIDSVCWNGKGDCYATFKTANPSSLVRDFTNLKFVTVDLDKYEPEFSADRPGMILPELEPDDNNNELISSPTNEKLDTYSIKTPHCKGLEFSEILTYYEDSSEEQFIEFYNTTDYDIKLDGCAIKYKNKRRELSGIVPASGYYAFYPDDFTLTKNPTKTNTLELLDADDSKLDELIYKHGQKKSTSLASFGANNSGEKQWLLTYDPTPNAPNNFQEFQTCEEGKVINPATGNCIKAAATTTKTLADCPEGKYRNPLTGRCKNIENSSTAQKECAEGYERNPETNRCRKIKTENQGADYPLVPETYADNKTFVAFGAVGLVILGGVSYVIWQYRREISRALRKLRNRLH